MLGTEDKNLAFVFASVRLRSRCRLVCPENLLSVLLAPVCIPSYV